MVNFLWDNLFRKDKRDQDLLTLLKDNVIFASLSTAELNFVKELVHIRTYRPSESVFRQGETGVGMYVIAKGAVDVFVEDLQSDDPDKRMVFITRLTAGDFFGELSLVEDNDRRTATVLSSDETTLVGFFRPDLTEIIERNPSTGLKIFFQLSRVLGKRLKETTQKVSELKRELKRLSEPS